MISPDGSISMQIGESQEFHSTFFKIGRGTKSTIEVPLHDGGFLYTKDTNAGSFVLISRKLKN